MKNGLIEEVVIDANVLFSRLKRNILLCLADADYFVPRWNRTILDETRRNLVKEGKMSSAKCNQVVGRMNMAFPSALVSNYRVLNRKVNSINQKDRHVAKTALYISASKIITEDTNFRFELRNLGLECSTADEYIAEIIKIYGKIAIIEIKKAKKLLNNSLSGKKIHNES